MHMHMISVDLEGVDLVPVDRVDPLVGGLLLVEGKPHVAGLLVRRRTAASTTRSSSTEWADVRSPEHLWQQFGGHVARYYARVKNNATRYSHPLIRSARPSHL